MVGKDETGQNSKTGRNVEETLSTQSNPKEEQPKSSPGIELISDISL